jgi:hypothetical protein
MDTASTLEPITEFHKLNNKWNLWGHLPQDTDWTAPSYKKLYQFTNVEDTIAITKSLPESLVKNCMLFIMKDRITPMWEDPQNRNGGCFSYKVSNKNVYEVWRDLTYVLVGETISTNAVFVNSSNFNNLNIFGVLNCIANPNPVDVLLTY